MERENFECVVCMPEVLRMLGPHAAQGVGCAWRLTHVVVTQAALLLYIWNLRFQINDCMLYGKC